MDYRSDTEGCEHILGRTQHGLDYETTKFNHQVHQTQP